MTAPPTAWTSGTLKLVERQGGHLLPLELAGR